MKNSKVIAKAKKLGLTVETGHNNKYYIVHNGKVASWYGNQNGEGEAHLFTSSRKDKSLTLTLTTTLDTLLITPLSSSTLLFPQVPSLSQVL